LLFGDSFYEQNPQNGARNDDRNHHGVKNKAPRRDIAPEEMLYGEFEQVH
jgi:hypothetical protein